VLPRQLGMEGGAPQHRGVMGLGRWEHHVFPECVMYLVEDLFPVDLFAGRNTWRGHEAAFRADATVRRAAVSVRPFVSAAATRSSSI
jgi:hypothetical protein